MDSQAFFFHSTAWALATGVRTLETSLNLQRQFLEAASEMNLMPDETEGKQPVSEAAAKPEERKSDVSVAVTKIRNTEPASRLIAKARRNIQERHHSAAKP